MLRELIYLICIMKESGFLIFSNSVGGRGGGAGGGGISSS